MKEDLFAPIRAKIASDHKVNLNVNIVGLGKLNPQLLTKKCGPRKTGQDEIQLPSIPGWSKTQIKKLVGMEKELMGWIKKNKGNQSLFLENPLNALEKSGLKLDRNLQKKLSRSKLSGEKNFKLEKGFSLGKINVSVKKPIVKIIPNNTPDLK